MNFLYKPSPTEGLASQASVTERPFGAPACVQGARYAQ